MVVPTLQRFLSDPQEPPSEVVAKVAARILNTSVPGYIGCACGNEHRVTARLDQGALSRPGDGGEKRHVTPLAMALEIQQAYPVRNWRRRRGRAFWRSEQRMRSTRCSRDSCSGHPAAAPPCEAGRLAATRGECDGSCAERKVVW